MPDNTLPQHWQVPLWQADFGDPLVQLLPLQTFASRVEASNPTVRIVLKTPEPGLLFLRGQLGDKIAFEAYSVPPLSDGGPRRLGVFLNPDSDNETEQYFDHPEDAAVFIVAELSTAARRRSA